MKTLFDKRRTTIVLGAGFSNLYGYPIGSELVHSISDLLWRTGNSFFEGKFNPQFLDETKRTLLPSMEGSIDAYLHKRTQLKEIGYTAIAQILLQHEDENPAFLFRNNMFNPYRCIFDSFGDLRKLEDEKINIIIFNYDRTLEHYLMEHVKSKYVMNTTDAKRITDKISIAHTYGQMGYLPWQIAKEDERDKERLCINYGAAKIPSVDQVKIAARRMGTVYNKISTPMCKTDEMGDQRLKLALDLHHDSKTVLFMGFGYLKENMDFLGKPSLESGNAILGTSFNWDDMQRQQLFNDYGIYTSSEGNTIENLLVREKALRYINETYSNGI